MDAPLRIALQPARVDHAGRQIPAGTVQLGGVPRGAVLLLCERGELHTAGADVANVLARHGFESVVVEAAQLAAPGESTDRGQVEGAVGAMLDHLCGRDLHHGQVGVVGWGLGGRHALVAAGAFAVGGAVSLGPHDDNAEGLTLAPLAVRAPWLGLFAADDPSTPLRWVLEFGAAIDAVSTVHTETVAYPGVSRNFYQDSRYPLEHAASFDSWQRTIEWLNLRVVPRPSPLAMAWQARRPVA